MRTRHTLGMVLLLAPLGACHLLAPHNAAVVEDMGVLPEASTDLALSDAPFDVPDPPDGFLPPDATPDGPPPPDGLSPLLDIELDFPDLQPSDAMPPDIGKLDVGVSPTAACELNAKEVFKYAEDMVICQSTDGSKNDQCDADILCAVGWQLCPSQVFLDRGGAGTGAPPGLTAWIAGTIGYFNFKYQAPVGVIGSCSDTNVPNTDIAWPCTSTGPTYSKFTNLGIITSDVCYALGQPSAPQGFWLHRRKGLPYDATVCCKLP